MRSNNDWHLISDKEALKRLSVDMYKGLSEAEAAKRRRKFSRNSIWRVHCASSAESMMDSAFDIATVLLIISALCAALFDKSYEAGWIIVALISSALIRTVTYVKSNRILEESDRAKIPSASLIRDGKIKLVSASDITVGDIVFLEQGDTVPCDGRVISDGDVSVLERGITENKTPVKKFNTVIVLADDSQDVPCEFRSNMLFAGSSVISGSVRMAATAIGDDALVSMKQGGIEIGGDRKIEYIEKLKSRSRVTSLIMLACVLALTVLSMFVGDDFNLPDVFLSSMAMATAAMSEFLAVIGYIVVSVAIRDCADPHWRSSVTDKKSTKKRISSARAVIRDPYMLDDISQTDRVVFCGTSFFKSGEAVISAYRADGKLVSCEDNGRNTLKKDKNLERLISFALSASFSSNTSLSNSASSALPDSEMAEISKSASKAYLKKIRQAPSYDCVFVDHRNRDAVGSMNLETSLVITEGDYYAVSCGKIDDVLRCCNTVEGNSLLDGGENLHLTADMRKEIFRECASLEVGGSRVVAIAKRLSQFKDLSRLPVLTEYMTFVGYIVISEKCEAGAPAGAEYIRKNGIEPIIFSTDTQSDYYYLRRIGLIGKNAVIVNAAELASHEEIDGIKFGEGVIVSFDSVSEADSIPLSSMIIKKLKITHSADTDGNKIHKITSAVASSVYSSGILKEADYGVTVASISHKNVPEILAKNSSAVVYPDHAGGFGGFVRLIKSANRAVNNIAFAQFYLTAAQSARLVIMLFSVLFSLPAPSPVFLLLWGLIFDFAAVLVISFENSFKKRSLHKTKRDFPRALLAGAVSGCALTLFSYLMTLALPTGKATAVLSASTLLYSLMAAEIIMKQDGISKKKPSNNLDLTFTALTLLTAVFLLLTSTGAKITGGTKAELGALYALIPPAVLAITIAATSVFKKKRK